MPSKAKKAKRNKQKNRQDRLLNFLGILFLTAGIIRFIILILTANWRHFFWLSNHIMLLLGIGVLMRNKVLVTAELCIALVPETLWTLDFLSKILFGKYLFGVTKYVFEQGLNFLTVSTMQHLLIVPLGIIALWFLGVSSKAWKYSFIHASLLWLAGFLIGKEYNLNCVFKNCITYFENLQNYMIAWSVIVLIMIILSNLALTGLNSLKKRF
jgi:hypothetical protein